jgi:hypothetical protein
VKLSGLASYILCGVGVALCMGPVFKAWGSNLRYPVAKLKLLNQLRTNPNQALGMCRMLPESFYAAVGAAIEAAWMTQSTDPEIIQQTTTPTFDAGGTGVSIKWKMHLMKAKLGVMAGVGGFLLALSAGSGPIIQAICAAATVAAIVWLFVVKQEVDASIIRARAEILPEVNRVFIEGRYTVAPPNFG